MFEVSRVINYNSVILGWAKGGTLEPTSSYFGYAWHWTAVTLLKEISNIKEIVHICFCVCVLRTWMCVFLYGQTGWGCISSKKYVDVDPLKPFYSKLETKSFFYSIWSYRCHLSQEICSSPSIFVAREIKQNRWRIIFIHLVLFTIYENQKCHFF